MRQMTPGWVVVLFEGKLKVLVPLLLLKPLAAHEDSKPNIHNTLCRQVIFHACEKSCPKSISISLYEH